MSHSTTDATYQRIGDPALLDKIDRLFACNVGEYVNLPQLVVVGDQSSGKSSVLEGLTRLPFPRDSGLCTRFATQITFRRAAEPTVRVSILPDPDSSGTHKDHVRAWGRSDIQRLDASTFATIIKEVHTIMGLGADQGSSSGVRKTFSNDVLRLEIHGPKEAHLSVIDVPGIFRTTTKGVTTSADKEMVRQMVETYMANPRTVMLAVVPANVDPATQEILEMAKDVDPEGSRTIGVMTKPDLVDKGAEDKVVELIEGKASDTRLEWSVVRNPGQKELAHSELDRGAIEESFFQRTSPWNTLSHDKRGIDSLRSRLEEVLTRHIEREFPKVRAEISKKLTASKLALDSLGAERDTGDKQSKFLLGLATRFQHVASLAIKADYGGEVIFDTEPQVRLATEMVRRNEKFSKSMTAFGHQYEFRKDDSITDERIWNPVTQDVHLNPTRMVSNAREIEEILSTAEEVKGPSTRDILAWLKETYQRFRGFELGTFDPSLIQAAMRRQSCNWCAISSGYASDSVALVHNFVTRLLQLLCGDERVHRNLMSFLLDDMLEKYRKGLSQVEFLLEVELNGVPMTLNHYLSDNLEKRRRERITSGLASCITKEFGTEKYVPLLKVMQVQSMSNADHAIQDIHDILHAYYKVARKRFIDNCCMHGISYYLVHGPDTPLKLFSPSFVNSLTDKQLEEISGENDGLKRKRAQLKKEIRDLEARKKVVMM